MNYEENTSSGAAPARARENEPVQEGSGRVPPAGDPVSVSPSHEWAGVSDSQPPSGHFHRAISGDLAVPWGWLDIAMFVVLGLAGSVVIAWGIGQIAIRFFGVSYDAVFGTEMSTAKSVVVLISQALLDAFAVLYLYIMLLTRTPAPFWPTIGWREMNPGAGKIRDSALQLLAGGAVLAIAVSFAGGFLNSKENLPIEELLQARVSMILFGVLGVAVAPLVEETIFRGFLYPVIARWLGVAAGVVTTGTLFGLMHAAQLWGGWGQIALLIAVGIILTWVRARTGTVAASYFVHLGYNGLQLVGYLVYLVGAGHHK